MTNSPTAYWPLPSLLRSLSRAGWGPLAGREFQGVRSTLTALSNRLPDKSAEGLATAEQIAAAAGLSERWVRRCLTILEDAGIITWQRGGVIDGRPAPSFFQVAKRTLVALINKARGIRSEAEAEHRSKTKKRIADAGLTYTMRPGRRKKKPAKSRGSRHAELSASLSTPYGGMPLGGHSRPVEKDQEMNYKNLQVTQEQETELLHHLQHRKLIEKQRQVARDNEDGKRLRADIERFRQTMPAGTSHAEAAKAYALARFTRKAV